MKGTRFDASYVGLARNTASTAISKVQAFLQRTGYLATQDPKDAFASLKSRASLPASRAGVFDDAMVLALVRYQRFHGLPVTGRLDANTISMMNRPRCGFPDVPRLGNFTAQGNRWTTTSLTYRIDNFTADLTQQEGSRRRARTMECSDATVVSRGEYRR